MKRKAVDQMDEDINPYVDEALRRGLHAPASFAAKIREAAENFKKGRGGARPNAGRKTLGHVPTSLALDPKARAYLVRKAGGKRGMSAVANRIFLKAMERDRSAIR